MRAVVVFVLIVCICAPARAQQPAPDDPAALTKVAPDLIDATKLGVSLSRIQRQLRIAESREQVSGDGLRLEFNVQVFGTAPKINVLQGVDLIGGHVPGSAPTHRQYIEYATPYMYRLPGLPISAAAAWAAQWMWKESKKSRCEEEIANYRALVMQGVNVAAPRCTQ